MGERENQIKKQILQYLQLRGHTAWNTNQGRLKGKYRMGSVGAPDIQGFSIDGHFIGIEVKADAGRLSPAQLKFRRVLQRTPYGIYVEARDLSDVEKAGL